MVTAKFCSDLCFPSPRPLSYAAIPSARELGQKDEWYWWMFWLLYQLKNKLIRFTHSLETFTSLNSWRSLSGILVRITILSGYNNIINGQKQLSLWTWVSTCSQLYLICKTLHTACTYLRQNRKSEEVSIESMKESNVNAKRKDHPAVIIVVLRPSGPQG